MATSTLGNGTLVLAGTTSGTTTVTATAVAGTTTLTLPAATDTLVGKATTDTLTNKTLTTPSVSSPTISDGTANGVAYLNGSKVLTTGSALVFDGSNFGVGVTPSAWGSGITAIQLAKDTSVSSHTTGGNLFVNSNTYYNGSNWVYSATRGASQYQQNDAQHIWYQAASGTAGNTISFTQAMTLDSSGNLLVGTTSAGGRLTVHAQSGVAPCYFKVATNGDAGIFFANASNTIVGQVTVNSASTAYVTSSDYRLKENISSMTGALATVAQLNPVTYKWKSDGSDGQGFIAHELQAIVPDAVVGEKDAVNDDGSIKPQGIDTSFLVATLTAAIQEQQTLITQLQADVAALKGATP